MDNKVQNIVLKALMVLIIGTGVLLTYWVMNDDNPLPLKPEEHRQWTYIEWNEWKKEKGKVLSEDGGLRKITNNDTWIDDEVKILTKDGDSLDVFLTANIILDELTKDSGLESDSIKTLKNEVLKVLSISDEDSRDAPLFTSQVDSWINYRTEQLVKIKSDILLADVSKVIGFTRLLLILAVVLVLASFVYLITIDYIKALKILAGILLLGLFMWITYFMASDQVPVCISAMEGDLEVCQEPIYSSANWKIASAAILTTIILIVVTILAWISGPIMKLFR